VFTVRFTSGHIAQGIRPKMLCSSTTNQPHDTLHRSLMFYANNWHYRELADFYPQGWLDDSLEDYDMPKVVYPETAPKTVDSGFIDQYLYAPSKMKLNDLSGWNEDMVKLALCARKMYRMGKLW